MVLINGKTSIVVSMVGVFVMLLLTIVNITSGYSDKEVAEMKAKLDSIDTRTINTDRDVAVLKERYKSIDESLDDIKEQVKLDATKIISVLVLSTLALNLGTAYAHDPYAPEYWPTHFPVGQVDENFNELTADEWFIFIGLTVSVCLMIALPKIFDGEMLKFSHNSLVDGRSKFEPRMLTKQISSTSQGEICLRLTISIG
jgi:hypothetical protein